MPAQLEETWRGQDAVNLLVVAVLVWSAGRPGARIAAGACRVGRGLAWIAYGYAHYAFGVPYTNVLLFYVALVALSAYGLLVGLLRIDVAAVALAFARPPGRSIAWYLLAGAVGFGGLWLTEILAAFPGR